MCQHQAIWDNRQHPRVHQAFARRFGEEKLWVSLDRANMKPPAREDKPDWNNRGMIHWDLDTSQQPIQFGVQGVLYLTDTAENQVVSSACRVLTPSMNGPRRSQKIATRTIQT